MPCKTYNGRNNSTRAVFKFFKCYTEVLKFCDRADHTDPRKKNLEHIVHTILIKCTLLHNSKKYKIFI